MSTTPTTPSARNPGGFRGYTNEQKTLRAKLDQVLKWTRDLKSNVMKQSCKALTPNTEHRETVGKIHDDIDEYKRKIDRELGRIHDICDAIAATLTNGTNGSDNGENRHYDEDILEALRRSPTYSSLEQHMDGDQKRPSIRLKPRERSHPGRGGGPSRAPFMSTNTTKRKASQPITWKLLDTSAMPGAKRRSQLDSFKRSRSYTNVEHTETQLGMDYIEEDGNDLAWKPFGPKKAVSQSSISFTHDDQPNDEETTTNTQPRTTQSLPSTPTEKPKRPAPPPEIDEASSDEEFDVAWQRRAKNQVQKEVAMPSTSSVSPTKRTVHFASVDQEPIEVIELDLENPSERQAGTAQTDDGQDELVISVAPLDDSSMPSTQQTEQHTPVSSSQQTTTSAPPQSTQNSVDESQIIDLSDDEIIALSENDVPGAGGNIFPTKVIWTASEIQLTGANSQSQSMHNPYRVGIADPSLRSIFLPPPGSQPLTTASIASKRTTASNRKTSPNKRPAGAK